MLSVPMAYQNLSMRCIELRSLSANSGSAWKVEADEGAWGGRIYDSRTDEAAQSPPM